MNDAIFNDWIRPRNKFKINAFAQTVQKEIHEDEESNHSLGQTEVYWHRMNNQKWFLKNHQVDVKILIVWIGIWPRVKPNWQTPILAIPKNLWIRISMVILCVNAIVKMLTVSSWIKIMPTNGVNIYFWNKNLKIAGNIKSPAADTTQFCFYFE